MGAWSYEAFGNDTALDWSVELAAASDQAVLESAFDRVLFRQVFDGSPYLDAHNGEVAVAAAVVVALLIDCDRTFSEPEPVRAWVSTHSDDKPSQELQRKAVDSLRIVLGRSSEMVDLWRESDEYKAWRKSVKQIQTAIEGPSCA